MTESAKLGKERFAKIYDYYAAFNHEFVANQLNNLNLSRDSVIVDPWNGSGTTSYVASLMNYRCYGYDINPAMKVVAEASLFSDKDLSHVERIIRDISYLPKFEGQSSSLFDRWFDETTKNIWVQFSIFSNSIDDSYTKSLYQLVVFKALKKSLKRFRTSNPTWIKKAKEVNDPIYLKRDEVIDLLMQSFTEISQNSSFKKVPFRNRKKTRLSNCSSTELELSDESCDVVISSPPYCTRLDYVITTSPELAVLGYSEQDLKDLKRKMIGSPTVNQDVSESEVQVLPEYCQTLLEQISSHPSKASGSYYYKTFRNYFVLIQKSLTEIRRILKPRGQCILVVQDSYYKNILVSLHRAYNEMFLDLGFEMIDSHHYKGGGLCLIHDNSSKVKESIIKLSKVS